MGKMILIPTLMTILCISPITSQYNPWWTRITKFQQDTTPNPILMKYWETDTTNDYYDYGLEQGRGPKQCRASCCAQFQECYDPTCNCECINNYICGCGCRLRK